VPLSIPFENIGDDFFRHWFPRREKQVVHHCISAISHRQRLRNKREASNLFQSFSERCNAFVVTLLDYLWPEEATLGAFRVRGLIPRIVSPKLGHPLGVARDNLLGILPDGIPVDIHGREIQKHIDGLGLSGLHHYFPIKVQAIWIQETEGAVVVFVLNFLGCS
jgi:hypothetical protein